MLILIYENFNFWEGKTDRALAEADLEMRLRNPAVAPASVLKLWPM